MELDLSKYLDIFETESREQLQRIEQGLLELEQTAEPERQELLQEIFRCAHTLKGAAASMELAELSAGAHALEDTLSALRDGTVGAKPAVIDALLGAVDVLREAVAAAGRGEPAPVDAERLRATLEAASAESAAEPMPVADPEATGEQPSGAGVETAASASPGTETIRVKVDQLDRLVDLVGELVTVRSRLVDVASRCESEALTEGIDQLTLLTRQLQTEILQTRMVPVARVFDRFPRMVRKLAAELGKEVEFEMAGREIELDRVILDSLYEPLLHLLRNALDHGLESREERERAGKSPVGRVWLSARREREHVVIEVADDGRGMEAESLINLAIERGLLTREEAAVLSDSQALMLVCTPGFSTSGEVTHVSGRGVGMDVVKEAVETAGGTLEIASHPKQGTTFSLHLPVTLAIIHALLIRLGRETYALPLNNITEAIAYEDADIRTVHNHRVALVRDLVLPVVSLGELLEVEGLKTNGSRRLLAMEIGSRRLAVVVDSVLRQQEIVIKPLGGFLRQLRGFAGATILGEGRVVLVLDPASLLASL